MVNITYSLTFDYNCFYTESDLAKASPELLNKLSSASAIEGAITISAPEASTIKVIDELAPWIQNLCFLAVPNLSDGEPVRINYFSRSGFLELTPVGDKIELKGNLVNTSSYPNREFLQALVECGKRFLECMGKIKQHDDDYMANLNYVARFEEQARLALLE